MLLLFSENQYFNEKDGKTGKQTWSFEIEDATLYYEEDLKRLIDLIDNQKDIRIQILNILGDLIYANYELDTVKEVTLKID